MRSAMETALSWEEAENGPPEVAALFPNAHLIQAIIEYPVALPGGERDSFNDVFALWQDEVGLIVNMVEAKRDEPFGPTLDEWQSTSSSGRSERLAFLCEKLGLKADKLAGTIRYQLMHRTVSALLTARQYHAKRAVMLVQSFSPENRWFSDFDAFCAELGLQAQLNGVTSTRDFGGIDLSLGWVHSPFRSKIGSE